MDVFEPRFSMTGWIVSVGFAALGLGVSLLAWLPLKLMPPSERQSVPLLLPLIAIGISLAILLGALFFVSIYPTMRYELKEEGLWLRCGPFTSRIPYSEIKEIAKTNLKYHPTSTGWKLPGYAIGNVYYADRGYVRMCATSMCKNILLIKTDKSLYGVTPKDEERFVRSLKGKLE